MSIQRLAIVMHGVIGRMSLNLHPTRAWLVEPGALPA
jgi:hypothetical protein